MGGIIGGREIANKGVAVAGGWGYNRIGLWGDTGMRLAIKVLGLALILAGLFLAGFLVWGGRFESLFSREACVAWFREIRAVAWLVALGLLVADLLLPVPSTGVMAALGAVYGTWLGAAIGAAGSILSGLAGYGLARWAGVRGARWIADDAERERFRTVFDRWGGAVIILSRMTPIFPEVLTLLAGLARMHVGRFLVALILGSVPTAILYAWIGHMSTERPGYGLALAVLLPLAAWPVVALGVGTQRGGAGKEDPPDAVRDVPS
jgi:uncharacterized membrane protein YdjX (TVP38/TMEM64 family)